MHPIQRKMGKHIHSFLFFNDLRPINQASRIRRFQCIKYTKWFRKTHPYGNKGMGTVNQRGGF